MKRKDKIKEALRKVVKEEINNIDTNSTFTITLRNGEKIKNVKFFKNGEWYQDTETGRKVGGKVPEGSIVNENQPAPSKPQTSPGPAIAPGKPGEKPGPRRTLVNPNVKPKPNAMKEEEMLDKIVNRFKTKKDIKETYSGNFTSEWRQGYKTGYNEGFEAAKNNKPNKFQK